MSMLCTLTVQCTLYTVYSILKIFLNIVYIFNTKITEKLKPFLIKFQYMNNGFGWVRFMNNWGQKSRYTVFFVVVIASTVFNGIR